MKKDIPIKKVSDLAIAIVPRPQMPEEDELWDTFIINLREKPIQNVLIRSHGYGPVKGDSRKTTVLRHFFEEIGPQKAMLIEPIHRQLFSLTNEYWVSFTADDYMYDKKYVFVRGSIDEQHFTLIPLVDRNGVMIR